MFGTGKTTAVKENAAAAAELAAKLASDKKFRKQLLAAAGHGVRAKRRARRQIGIVTLASRLAADRRLRAELVQMVRELQNAWKRVEHKRSHHLRNSLLVVAGAGGAAAAAPQTRQFVSDLTGVAPHVVDGALEVEAPVSTVYNQWTQFEEFPRFMEGVEDVRQLDDTRLHWVASVGGKRAEWDAKILEQHPDRQVSWISEDGRKTRGTVSFESLGESRALVRLSLSYQAEGFREALGSAAGFDRRRVQGDLRRFKELVEARGGESGGWRGDISAGVAESG